MRKVIIVSFLLLASIANSQDGLLNWTLNYNNNMRIFGGVVNPVNTNIMYVVSLDSGVYKTTNAGLNWFQVNNGITYFKAQCIDICRSNPNVLYIGTDSLGGLNSGVYKTTDAGANWVRVYNGVTDMAVQSIAVSPSNPDVVWICTFNGSGPAIGGLWKTTNGGLNWFVSNTGIASDNRNMLAVIVNPLNANVLYAGTSLVLPGSTGPSKIYRSNDGGSNWVQLTNGLPNLTTSNNPVRAMSFSTLDTGRVVAALFVNDTTGGIYLTTNSGQNWAKKWGIPNTTGTLPRSIGFRPGSNNEIYVGLDQSSLTTGRGVWRTTNGGQTWADFNSGALLNTMGIRALLWKTTGDTTLFAGAAGTTAALRGIFEYTWPAPPQIGWTEQNSGVTTSLNCVSATSLTNCWVGGNGGVVLRTVNGGNLWTNVGGGAIGTADVYAILGIDDNTCLVSTSPANTYVYRTSNGGLNWTQVFTQTGGFINDMKKTGTTIFMYGDPVGGRWSLWKSTNNGLTFDSTGLYIPQAGSEAGWNNSMFAEGSRIFFGTNNTRVYYTTNMGLSWNYSLTTGSANSYSVAFIGNTGFTGQTVTLKSTNGGVNWSTVTLPGTGTAFSFIKGGNNFWYARGSGIYNSSDAGNNFNLQYTAPAGTIYCMSMYWTATTLQPSEFFSGWAVRSNGGISRYYNAIITGIENNNPEMPSDFALLQNYPNPFNALTNIKYQILNPVNVKIVVFDILGKEVATIVNEYKSPGTYSVSFNAANLSSGVYFYKMTAGDFTDVKRMILTK